jgi:hypothetical protein
MAISNVQGTLTVDETIINGTVSINGTIINGAVYINGQGEQGIQGVQGIQGIQGESGTFDGIPLSGTTALNPITGKLEYSSNLSETFTARSLVDKGYLVQNYQPIIDFRKKISIVEDFSSDIRIFLFQNINGATNNQLGFSYNEWQLKTNNQFNGRVSMYQLFLQRIDTGISTNNCLLKIPTLANANDKFYVIMGKGSATVANLSGAAVFIVYDKFGELYGTSSDNWLFVVRQSNVNTIYDSGIAVTNLYTKIGFNILSLSQVGFYINNVLIYTMNATILSTTYYNVLQINKTLGTNSVEINLDYYEYNFEYYVPRL